VSGITGGLAENIVAHRDANGPFRTRKGLKDVARLGPKAFEQCAGFLRIPGGDDPLDSSSVHPEAYPVVRRILAQTGGELKTLIGNGGVLRGLRPSAFADETFGVPTVTDILRELEKPGRDPRPAFRTAAFKEGVEKLSDLEPGMLLEGTVTNVAAFGAFVDIGVHQDGLVHVSALSKTFVKDPREVVKSGDIVRVKVLDVDIPRKRISLTLRLDDEAQPGARSGQRPDRGQERGQDQQRAPRQQQGRQPARQSDQQQSGQQQSGQRQGRQQAGQQQDQPGGGRQGQSRQQPSRAPRPRGGGDSAGGGGAMADALRRAGLG